MLGLTKNVALCWVRYVGSQKKLQLKSLFLLIFLFYFNLYLDLRFVGSVHCIKMFSTFGILTTPRMELFRADVNKL